MNIETKSEAETSYAPPEVAEKSGEKSTEKAAEKVPEKSANKLENLFFDRKTKQPIDITSLKDSQGRTFSETLHVHTVSGGKYFLLLTKTGQLRINSKAQAEGHAERVASQAAKLSEEQRKAAEEMKAKAEEKLTEEQKIQRAKDAIPYTANFVVQAFINFGKMAFGSSFEPQDNAEFKSLRDATVDYLEYSGGIQVSPFWGMVGVYTMYALNRKPEPESFLGKRLNRKPAAAQKIDKENGK